MSKDNNNGTGCTLQGALYSIFCVATAMVGKTIHGSLFWAIVDFFFSPLAWGKWLICREVSLSIIRNTFGFFLQ